MKRIDISGQRFGKLVVLSRIQNSRWKCVCDCGKDTVVAGDNLKRGRTKSCGCGEIANRIKHGLNRTPIYKSWHAMHGRCYHPSTNRFEHYGGRGIQVCSRWHKGTPSALQNFLSDMGHRPEGTTLDRINHDSHYMPSNCRWATPKEQRANRRQDHRTANKMPKE